MEQLARKINSEFSGKLQVTEQKKEFLVLELLGDTTKQQVLKMLGETDIDVDRFGRYEPSLNDIFVATVGEDAKSTECGATEEN